VCICVLYYCHRVSTQLQLTNISYISCCVRFQITSKGMDNNHPVHRSLLCIPFLTTVVHECDGLDETVWCGYSCCRCHSTYPQIADWEERFTETSIIAVPKISAVPFFCKDKDHDWWLSWPKEDKWKIVTLQSVFLWGQFFFLFCMHSVGGMYDRTECRMFGRRLPNHLSYE